MLHINCPESSRDTQIDKDVLPKKAVIHQLTRKSIMNHGEGAYHGLLGNRTRADFGGRVGTHTSPLERPCGLIRCDPADVLLMPKRDHA